MIIHNLNLGRPFRCPSEAHAILVIYANAVLAGSVASQRLETIAGRHAEIIETFGPMQHRQFAHCHRFDLYESPDAPAFE